jgi:hypothetical protein
MPLDRAYCPTRVLDTMHTICLPYRPCRGPADTDEAENFRALPYLKATIAGRGEYLRLCTHRILLDLELMSLVDQLQIAVPAVFQQRGYPRKDWCDMAGNYQRRSRCFKRRAAGGVRACGFGLWVDEPEFLCP